MRLTVEAVSLVRRGRRVSAQLGGGWGEMPAEIWSLLVYTIGWKIFRGRKPGFTRGADGVLTTKSLFSVVSTCTSDDIALVMKHVAIGKPAGFSTQE